MVDRRSGPTRARKRSKPRRGRRRFATVLVLGAGISFGSFSSGCVTRTVIVADPCPGWSEEAILELDHLVRLQAVGRLILPSMRGGEGCRLGALDCAPVGETTELPALEEQIGIQSRYCEGVQAAIHG